MRSLVLCCWVIGAFSLYAQDPAQEDAVERDPYEGVNFEFDIDLDICGLSGIKKWCNTCTDFGWRFLGYDSNSFSAAKNYFRGPDNRIKLALALLVVNKYPGVMGLNGVNYLREEIVEGKICLLDKNINNEIESIQLSKKFTEIYDTIVLLNKYEQRSLAQILIATKPFQVLEGRNQSLSNYLFELGQCFKPMLQKIIKE